MSMQKLSLLTQLTIAIVLVIISSLILSSCTASEERDSKQVVYGRVIEGKWKVISNSTTPGQNISTYLLTPSTVIEFFRDGSISLGPNSLVCNYGWPDEDHLRVDSPSDQNYGAGVVFHVSPYIVEFNHE